MGAVLSPRLQLPLWCWQKRPRTAPMMTFKGVYFLTTMRKGMVDAIPRPWRQVARKHKHCLSFASHSNAWAQGGQGSSTYASVWVRMGAGQNALARSRTEDRRSKAEDRAAPSCPRSWHHCHLVVSHTCAAPLAQRPHLCTMIQVPTGPIARGRWCRQGAAQSRVRRQY